VRATKRKNDDRRRGGTLVQGSDGGAAIG